MTSELRKLIINFKVPADITAYGAIKFYTSDGLSFEVKSEEIESIQRRITNETNVKNDIMSIIGEE